MPYTDAQNKATQRYVSNTYDTFAFRILKGERDKLRAAAQEAGYSSIPAYLIALVNADRGQTVLTERRKPTEPRKRRKAPDPEA